MKVKFKQDEYMYLFDEVMGSSTVFHNKTLRDTTGDALILAMAQEILELQEKLAETSKDS